METYIPLNASFTDITIRGGWNPETLTETNREVEGDYLTLDLRAESRERTLRFPSLEVAREFVVKVLLNRELIISYHRKHIVRNFTHGPDTREPECISYGMSPHPASYTYGHIPFERLFVTHRTNGIRYRVSEIVGDAADAEKFTRLMNALP